MTFERDKTGFIEELPEHGIAAESLLERMSSLKSACGDVDWQRGRSWSLVYYGGAEHTRLLHEAYGRFFSENALSSAAFPSLRHMEQDVVGMIRGLLRGNSAVGGTMTSGGTESILLACKAYRDRAGSTHPGLSRPEILLPASAHPAFLKAAQFLGLTPVVVPLADDFRSDLDALRARLTDNTICIVASAPCYPHGVVDRIPEMATIALDAGIGLHVDACLGGFLLPFMRDLGENVTDFDFAVPGVSSISTDLHKNGYAAKGASAVLYRDEELQQHQYFVSVDWPGGVYTSPTLLGTRPGGVIAAAWAAMLALGRAGYRQMAGLTRELTREFVAMIGEIDGLELVCDVDVNVVCVGGASDLDIFQVADLLEDSGWRMDRQRQPDCLHHILTPNHRQALGDYRHDLVAACRESRQAPRADGTSVSDVYGVTVDLSPADRSETALRSALAASLRLPATRR